MSSTSRIPCASTANRPVDRPGEAFITALNFESENTPKKQTPGPEKRPQRTTQQIAQTPGSKRRPNNLAQQKHFPFRQFHNNPQGTILTIPQPSLSGWIKTGTGTVRLGNWISGTVMLKGMVAENSQRRSPDTKQHPRKRTFIRIRSTD